MTWTCYYCKKEIVELSDAVFDTNGPTQCVTCFNSRVKKK